MKELKLDRTFVKNLWIRKSGLAGTAPFGLGKEGAYAALRRIGYAQIDTIFVVERAHHHILWSRVPDYRPEYLHVLQSEDKKVFEYWTHALAYIPVEDFRHFVRSMKYHEKNPSAWFSEVTPAVRRRLLDRIEREGPLSMRQIEEEKKEKDHEWASRKPSKRVLEHLFYSGRLAVSRREGMLKNYELLERHFAWRDRPEPSTLVEESAYRIDRALNSQGVITLESASYLETSARVRITQELEARIKRGELLPARVENFSKLAYVRPEDLGGTAGIPTGSEDAIDPERISILSPFDPLVIQRKRTSALFDFDYLIECYVPAPKRKFGYFSLPILEGNRFIARLDLKADRKNGKLLVQAWHWETRPENRTAAKRAARGRIEDKLEHFKSFQFTRREEYSPSRKPS